MPRQASSRSCHGGGWTRAGIRLAIDWRSDNTGASADPPNARSGTTGPAKSRPGYNVLLRATIFACCHFRANRLAGRPGRPIQYSFAKLLLSGSRRMYCRARKKRSNSVCTQCDYQRSCSMLSCCSPLEQPGQRINKINNMPSTALYHLGAAPANRLALGPVCRR